MQNKQYILYILIYYCIVQRNFRCQTMKVKPYVYIILNTSRKHVNYEEDKNKVYNIQNTNICNGIFHISFFKAIINEGETTQGENWGVFNITQKRKTLPMFDIFKEWEMEKLNLKYCKYILGVTKLCTNIAVLSELGRYPLYIDLLKQLFMYWYRLEHSPSDILSRAYNEYKSSNNQSNNSWYTNLLFSVKN